MRRLSGKGLLALALGASLSACLETPPQAPPHHPKATGVTEATVPAKATPVVGSDFERLNRGPLGSTQLDDRCAQPFDSANPFVMALEMATLLETPRLEDALASKLGFHDKRDPRHRQQQREQQREMLKQTARHKVWLPVAAETLVGQQLHQTLVQQRMLVPDDQLHPRDMARLAHIRQWLNRLVQALPAGQPYRFQLHATRERGSTMAAQMGGFVYVSEGLLRDRGLQDGDIALRLSHEIAHITKRHVLRDFQTKAVDAFTIGNWTLHDLSKLNDGPAMLDLVRKRYTWAQTLSRSFDHANELEADSCAIRLLRQVLPEEDIRRAVANFVQHAHLRNQADQHTHPSSEQRLRMMTRQLQP